MRIDPQVNRPKVDCELGRLYDQESVLQSRGIFNYAKSEEARSSLSVNSM
jgi:hypothetical protein